MVGKEESKLIPMSPTVDWDEYRTEDIYLRLYIPGFSQKETLRGAQAFVTTESQNCCETDCVGYRPFGGAVYGFEAIIPSKSIYTITNVA